MALQSIIFHRLNFFAYRYMFRSSWDHHQAVSYNRTKLIELSIWIHILVQYWLIVEPFVVLMDTLPNHKFVTHNRMHTIKITSSCLYQPVPLSCLWKPCMMWMTRHFTAVHCLRLYNDLSCGSSICATGCVPDSFANNIKWGSHHCVCLLLHFV
jgi:hypothetical protein